MSSPVEGLAAVAYLSFKAAQLEAQGVEEITEAEVTAFEDLSDGDQKAWVAAVAGVLGANKMLLVVTPVPEIAAVAKRAHDRAVITHLTLPGESVVGPEWDAAVLATFAAAHMVVPTEIAEAEFHGDKLYWLYGDRAGEPWMPEVIKRGQRVVVVLIPLEEKKDDAPC